MWLFNLSGTIQSGLDPVFPSDFFLVHWSLGQPHKSSNSLLYSLYASHSHTPLCYLRPFRSAALCLVIYFPEFLYFIRFLMSLTFSKLATEPTTRSRTLFFLSIRDSRAPSSRLRSTNGKNKSTAKEPFVIYGEDDEDDDTEQAQLLGNSKRTRSGHVAIDISDQPALPPSWYGFSVFIKSYSYFSNHYHS